MFAAIVAKFASADKWFRKIPGAEREDPRHACYDISMQMSLMLATEGNHSFMS